MTAVGAGFFSTHAARVACESATWLRFLESRRLSCCWGSGLFIELWRLRGQLATVREERAALERRADESERRLVHEREQSTEERVQASPCEGNLKISRPAEAGARQVSNVEKSNRFSCADARR